jgi:hypothetical protein
VNVTGSYAYVADHQDGLQILDISNPAAPKWVGGCDPGGYARGVTVAGSYAYVAIYRDGVQVIDVSNPAAPRWVGGCDTSGYAEAVAVAGSYVYVADSWGGLPILRVDVVGDTNCDRRITFSDINPFVLALSDPDEYRRRYPNCNWRNADCNDDGRVLFDDIHPFVLLLSGE